MSLADLTAFFLLFCGLSDVTGIGVDWCQVECLQENGQPVHHTMCDYQQGGGDICSGWTHGLSVEDKQVLLDYHNKLRQRIASGQETRGLGGGQPMASDMMELIWEPELEEVAQRWADQCEGGDYDRCHVASDGTEVGQNVVRKEWTDQTVDRKEVLERLVQDWYDEIDKFYTSDVDSVFTKSNYMEVRHFTQIVWASTTFLGCGLSHRQEEGEKKSVYRLVCNYKVAGNVRSIPIYTRRGEVTKVCSPWTSPSERYPGLCLSHEGGSMLEDAAREHKEVPKTSPVTQHTYQHEDEEHIENSPSESQSLQGSQLQEDQQESQSLQGSQLQEDQQESQSLQGSQLQEDQQVKGEEGEGQALEGQQEEQKDPSPEGQPPVGRQEEEKEGQQPHTNLNKQQENQPLEGQKKEHQHLVKEQKESRRRFRLTQTTDQEEPRQLAETAPENQGPSGNLAQKPQGPPQGRMVVRLIQAASNRPTGLDQIGAMMGGQTSPSVEQLKRLMASRGAQLGIRGSPQQRVLLFRQMIMRRTTEPGNPEGQPSTPSDQPNEPATSQKKTIVVMRLMKVSKQVN